MKYLKKFKSIFESIKSNTDKAKNKSDLLIENVNYHKTSIRNLGELEIPDPAVGDLKLSVMPFENNGEWVSLPDGFKLWEDAFNKILKCIPLQEGANTHYVTIDTKFFTTDEFLRREGVHIDGNFCVDPYFKSVNEMASWGGASYNPPPRSSWGGAKFDSGSKSSWGGAKFDDDSKSSWGGAKFSSGIKSSWGGAKFDTDSKSSWGGAKFESDKSSWGGASWGGARFKPNENDKIKIDIKEDGIGRVVRDGVFEEKSDNSHVKMDWVLPYDIVIPISEYVSGEKGGILTISTEVGCQAWIGEFYGEVGSEGSFENMKDQLTDDRKIVFEKNQLYFMSSNTPHETLLISKGKRRSFMRITLNHNYNNSNIKEI